MAAFCVCGIIGLFAVLIYLGAAVIEGQYNRAHPPEDDGGAREDERHDEP